MTTTAGRVDDSNNCDVIRVMPYDRVIVVPGPLQAKPSGHANHRPLLGIIRTVDLGPSCCDGEGHPGDLWSTFVWLSSADDRAVAKTTAEKVRNWRWSLGGKRGSDRRDAEDDAELRGASMEFVRMVGLHGRGFLREQGGWDGMLSDRIDAALDELFEGPGAGSPGRREDKERDVGPSYVARPNRVTARGVRSFLSAVDDFLFVHSTGSEGAFPLLSELLWTVLDSDIVLAALSRPGHERDMVWSVAKRLMVRHAPPARQGDELADAAVRDLRVARTTVLRRLYDAAMGSNGVEGAREDVSL
jgi:hypothetical protein